MTASAAPAPGLLALTKLDNTDLAVTPRIRRGRAGEQVAIFPTTSWSCLPGIVGTFRSTGTMAVATSAVVRSMPTATSRKSTIIELRSDIDDTT
ncbi:hypothetical protein ACIBI3_04845 [Actinomadura luteofluorescens]|uniref:hypothetical protein n=1 Tax=Actinomadura luteofluorescens TaxID=46163 RepID=UPI003488296E